MKSPAIVGALLLLCSTAFAERYEVVVSHIDGDFYTAYPSHAPLQESLVQVDEYSCPTYGVWREDAILDVTFHRGLTEDGHSFSFVLGELVFPERGESCEIDMLWVEAVGR